MKKEKNGVKKNSEQVLNNKKNIKLEKYDDIIVPIKKKKTVIKNEIKLIKNNNNNNNNINIKKVKNTNNNNSNKVKNNNDKIIKDNIINKNNNKNINKIKKINEVNNKTNKKSIEKNIINKNKVKNKINKIVFIIFLIFIFIICLFIYCLLKPELPNLIKGNDNIKINYELYYSDYVNTITEKDVYEIDTEIKKVGKVSKDMYLELERDEYFYQGYYKIKGVNYYINYKNIESSNSSLNKKTFNNYIPYNLSVKTNKETNLYLDNNLVFTLNKGMDFPIIYQDNDYYGVAFDERILYLKKDSDLLVYENINTNLKHTSSIAVLAYHFTYDSSNPKEVSECRQIICLSDKQFLDHMSYIKDNNFYTATMQDLELFIDGKIQLPEKTVVVTIDDGYHVKESIKILEKLDLHATLFLIGVAGDPSNYQSPNLEIHSHSYNLHYPGACSGGQGSPIKCINKDTILADLKKSRDQLNQTTVFCYPFFEYNDYAINLLKEAGFKMAFAGTRTKVRVGTNKYKIPRYGVVNTTTVHDIKRIITP